MATSQMLQGPAQRRIRQLGGTATAGHWLIAPHLRRAEHRYKALIEVLFPAPDPAAGAHLPACPKGPSAAASITQQLQGMGLRVPAP